MSETVFKLKGHKIWRYFQSLSFKYFIKQFLLQKLATKSIPTDILWTYNSIWPTCQIFTGVYQHVGEKWFKEKVYPSLGDSAPWHNHSIIDKNNNKNYVIVTSGLMLKIPTTPPRPPSDQCFIHKQW